MNDPLSTSFCMAIDLFQLDNKSRRYTHNTLEHYRFQLGSFLAFCESHSAPMLGQITPMLIRAYLVTLQEKQLSDHSIHAAARAIRRFINFCINEELLEQSPMKRVKMPKLDRKILPSFSAEDVQQLLNACESERDKAIVLCLLDTGARSSEFVKLVGSDIDKSGEVKIRGGKGGKDRTVYLGARSLKQLYRYFLTRGKPKDNQPVWISIQTKDALTTSGLRQLLERIGIRGNVTHCHPHTFRRTFAIWSLRAGMSIFHLQRLLGHEDITVLRQYLALAQDDLQEAHSRANVVSTLLDR